ncbi:MAG TPA: hypothetical protein VNO20_02940 [Solirubrobacterales bacterium]|nr:hypothetical protein [Solirubrobacterales bacterium]
MAFSRHVHLSDEAVEVRFTGLLSLKTLRRRLSVPYSRIVLVSTEPFDDKRGLLRIAGYALGRSLHGLFRQRGRWLFLSFENPRQVIHLKLDPTGAGWPRLEEVVLQVPDPDSTVTEIERRRMPRVAAAE